MPNPGLGMKPKGPFRNLWRPSSMPFGSGRKGKAKSPKEKPKKKVELEKIEKTQKGQFRYQIIILETWTLYLILTTWLTEDILLIKKVDLLGKNQS